MKIEVKAAGIENADAMITFMRELGSQTTGAVLHGQQRSDRPGLSNADVIKYLKDGVEREDGIHYRDLGPTQDDASAARALYMARVNERLRLLAAKAGAEQKAKFAGSLQASKMAETANSSGLMAGARSVADRMRARAERQITVHGGTEQAADPVSERYAARRQKMYGVPGSVVYRASGQILRNLTGGGVRLVRNRSLLDTWRSLLGAGGE